MFRTRDIIGDYTLIRKLDAEVSVSFGSPNMIKNFSLSNYLISIKLTGDQSLKEKIAKNSVKPEVQKV